MEIVKSVSRIHSHEALDAIKGHNNIQNSSALLSEKQLGPLQLESANEPINRCFGLLKYFQH